MRLHIDVTEEDIREGIQGSATQCMVHKAIDRCTEGALPQFLVFQDEIHFSKDSDLVVLPLPPIATSKIKLWDTNFYRVHPFSFDLELPESVVT